MVEVLTALAVVVERSTDLEKGFMQVDLCRDRGHLIPMELKPKY